MSEQLAMFGSEPESDAAPAADIETREAIGADLDSTLFVEAGAGSGKTTALVERVAALVLDAGVPVREIAAITFTEKAAAELRVRLRQRFAAEIVPATDPDRREAARVALDDLDGAAISTLHAFAQRILGEHPIEAGLPPGVEVLDEISSAVAFDERWADTVDTILDDPELERTILLGDAVGITPTRLRDVALAFHDNWDLVDARLDREVSSGRPVDIASLVDQLAAVVAERDHCLDDDDTMLAKLDDYAAIVDAARAATDEAEQLGLVCEPTYKVSRAGRAANWPDINDLRERVAAVGEACAAARAQVVENCLERFTVAIGEAILAGAAERRTTGRLEFHDLLVLARSMLRNPEHGVEVRSALRRRYRRLLLDEFQDTDPIQIDMAVLIASDDPDAADKRWPDIEVEPGRLFFVGDPKQSIYRFRRADISLFLEARGVFTTTPRRLTRNFRSTKPVIDWVNQVFGQLINHEEGSQPDYSALDAVRDEVPGPGVVLLGGDAHPQGTKAAELRAHEARDVVAAIRTAIDEPWRVRDGDDGDRPAQLGDITVLLPSRTSLSTLELALDAAAIPHRAESSSLVYSTAEVRDLLAVLRAIDDVTDELAVVTALRSPAFGCGDDDLHRYHVEHGGRWNHQDDPPESLAASDPVVEGLRWLGDAHRERFWATPSEMVGRVVAERRLLEMGFTTGRSRDLWRRLRFVIDQARAYHDAEGGTLRDFLDWCDRQSSGGARVVETVLPETDDDSVRIMTIHAAKGLEFPITIVSGMTTQASPTTRGTQVVFPPAGGIGIRLDVATATPAYEEFRPIDEQMGYHERLRLLYVATTRACDHLVVSVHRAERKSTPDPSRLTSAELLLDAAGATPKFLDAHPAVEVLPAAADSPGLPIEREAWLAERSAALSGSAHRRVVAASALVELAAPDRDPGLEKEPRDLDLPPWNRGRYGTAIGRAVHGVLQVIDLDTGEGLETAAAAQAAAEGIVNYQETIVGLVEAALASPSVREAVSSPRWREMYVTVPLGSRTLEGYIDLLYRTPDGLVVVDYKTDAWRDEAELDHKVARYRIQAAAYGVAVEAATGEKVDRCVLVFCTENGPVERTIADLDSARAEVRELVG